MLHEEVEKFSRLSGKDGHKTPISRIGGFLDGYETAKEEAKRTGKWEWCGDHHLCSECSGWALFKWDDNECDYVESLSDFCPDCGVRMVTE